MKPLALADSVNTLDMLVGLLLQAHAEGRTRKATTVLRFWTNMRIRRCDFLFRAMAEASDRIVCLGRNHLYDEVERICDEAGVECCRAVPAEEIAGTVDADTVMIRSHADVYEASNTIGTTIREQGAQVFGVLGGCYPPHDSIPLPYFKEARPDLLDTFLLYTEGHRAPLESVGYTRFETIGFPKLYPAWLDAVRNSPNVQRLRETKQSPTIAIMTRGEVSDTGPHIMPNRTLREILTGAIEELRAFFDECAIVIKPHPLQDESVLRDMVERYPRVSISHEHASVLACVSDLFVTTWSTTIFEALALGTPAIEFFVPNDYFRSVYTAGSAFKNLGIPAAETREEFATILRQVAAPGYPVPDAVGLFEHVPDLSLFDRERVA